MNAYSQERLAEIGKHVVDKQVSKLEALLDGFRVSRELVREVVEYAARDPWQLSVCSPLQLIRMYVQEKLEEPTKAVHELELPLLHYAVCGSVYVTKHGLGIRD